MSQKVNETGIRGYTVLAGVIQTAVFSLPFGVSHRPDWFYLFPPIGELEHFILPLSAILVGVASILPWFLDSLQAAKRLAYISAISIAVSFGLYLSCLSFRVVSFRDPMRGNDYTFSIGSTKSSLAKQTFGQDCEKQQKLISELGGDCDTGMIMAVGPNQQTVNALWTKSSLFQAHVQLLLTYLFCLILFNVFVGSTAKAAQLKHGV